MLTLVQQPCHAIDAVLLLVLRELGVREERPETVRKAGIKVDFGADATLFAKYLFIYQTFVSQRIHTADLEVCRWKALLTRLEENR